MKDKTPEILACPACHAYPFRVKASRQSGSEIDEGTLFCPSCGREYPVIDGIPRLLVCSDVLRKEHIEIRNANIEYHDAAADSYEADIEESMHQSEFNQSRINGIIEGLSRKTANDNFLDVGCGTGNLLKFGRRYFNSAVGTDVSIGMLRVAKSRGGEVIQADAASLPFRPEIFNAVSIFSVLHHLFDYERFLSEAARVLKPAGFLYTDWDPQKQIEIDRSCLTWRIYELLRVLYVPVRRLRSMFSKNKTVNLRDSRPELKRLYEKAEYRNLELDGCERGIDYSCLKKDLLRNGFTNIRPTYHWAGRVINELGFNLKVKFFFLRLQGYAAEEAMENLMVIAQKGYTVSLRQRIEESSGSIASAKNNVKTEPGAS